MDNYGYLQIVLSILGLIGIGGIITSFLNKKKEIAFKELEQKEKRYKSCLLYMDAYFKPENLKYLSSRQPDIDNEKDILEYLHAEYHEMLLYASKKVILTVKDFIKNPNEENFLKTIIEMRNDLWIKKRDIGIKEIKL